MFIFCFRPYAQVQSEPMQSAKKTKNQGKKGFSYLDGQQAPAQTSNTPWGAKLDQNVAGAQSNAEEFTQQFMQEMYGGSQAAVVSTNQQAATAVVSTNQQAAAAAVSTNQQAAVAAVSTNKEAAVVASTNQQAAQQLSQQQLSQQQQLKQQQHTVRNTL